MKQLLLLQPVDAGNGRLRLGLSTEDWHSVLGSEPVQDVSVRLTDGEANPAAITTYCDYGSLTSPEINAWLTERAYPLNDRVLLFELIAEEGIHTYTFLGVLQRENI